MNQLLRRNQPVISYQGLPSRLDALLPVGSQRQVGDACVAAVEGPFGFAVADDEAAGGHFLNLLF